MKLYFLQLITGALLLVTCSCKKENSCPSEENLGIITWSEESKSWIPPEYFNLLHSLTYISEENKEKKFEITYLFNGNDYGLTDSTLIKCEEGEGETNFIYTTTTHIINFTSSDSFVIRFVVNARNEKLTIENRNEMDFFDVISFFLFSPNDNYKYGFVQIITDLKNSEIDEIEYASNYFLFSDTLEIGDEVFQDIYSMQNPQSPLNIYAKKGKGIVAFIDEEGRTWKLKG